MLTPNEYLKKTEPGLIDLINKLIDLTNRFNWSN